MIIYLIPINQTNKNGCFFILYGMKKRFLFVVNICLIVSAVIGAGFATGQELMLYFNGKSVIFVSIICTIFFFVFFACSLIKDEKFLQSKQNDFFDVFYKKFINVFSLIASFVVLCAMMSGTRSVLKEIFTDKILSALLSDLLIIICFLVVLLNKSGLQIIGILFAPLMFVFLIVFAVNNNAFSVVGKVQGSIISSFFYVSLNSVFLTTLISEVCCDYTVKKKYFFCFISALICGILLFIALGNIQCYSNVDLPLVKLAFSNTGLGIFYCAMVLFGIITTLCASGLPIVKMLDTKISCRTLSSLIIFAIGRLVSLLDFAKFIAKCYPIISFFGGLVIILTLVKISRKIFLNKKYKIQVCHLSKTFSKSATRKYIAPASKHKTKIQVITKSSLNT